MKIKRYIKLTLPFVIIGLIGFLYSFASNRNAVKKINNSIVEFEAGENNFLTHNIVNKLLIQNGNVLVNQPKSVLDLHDLEQKVLANPYVEEAKVFASINGDLKTVIKQREPIARIVGNSTSYYIDKQGVKVPLSKNFSSRVVLISGVNVNSDLNELTALVNKILSDNFLKKEIIGIQKLALNEYRFNVRSGDYVVDFGKFRNTDKKFKKLKAFYNKAFADNTIGDYKKINVKYHNQVVCSK